jgi:hypothetical protein
LMSNTTRHNSKTLDIKTIGFLPSDINELKMLVCRLKKLASIQAKQ